MQKNLYRKPFITAIRHQLKISTNTPGLEERSFLFSLWFTRIMEVVVGSSNRRAVDWTSTGEFMCLSDIHAKKIPTPTEKVVLQKSG